MTKARIRELLSDRRVAAVAALLATLLTLPALWTGWHSDDYAHLLALRGEPTWPDQTGSPMGLFAFTRGDPERNRRAMEAGLLPWWSVETLRFSFWRPLTALTHLLDHQLWPDSPVLMHVHSVAWFALVVAFAAVLYRRIIGPGWVAGVAALLFAVDDAHAEAVTWIASRNTVISAAFAILALAAHDRWRRDGARWAGWIAPLSLLLGLLGGEGAVATTGYLCAYALFLERGSRSARILSLLPAATVTVAWYGVYVGLGYGTHGSGVYVDPGREPLAFALSVGERAPVQLLAQWAFPPTEWYVAFSADLGRQVWLAALIVTVLIVAVMAPLLRSDPRARFFATGMSLALLPNCSTVPFDRLLILVGLGALGLLALLFASLLDGVARVARSRFGRRIAGGFAVVMVFVHAVAAPILLPFRCHRYRDQLVETLATALPERAGATDRRVVVVNAPNGLWAPYVQTLRRAQGLPAPERFHVLATGVRPLEIARPGPRTLVIRPAGGFLVPPAAWAGTGPAPPVSPAYVSQRADLVFRGPRHPMRRGQRVELSGFTVEVTALTPDGRPAEATFYFDVPLEDPALIWLRCDPLSCVPFEVPPLGQTVRLPGLF